MIPHIVLASNGEDEKVVAEYKVVLEVEKKLGVVETYANMHHGWSEYLFSLIVQVRPSMKRIMLTMT